MLSLSNPSSASNLTSVSNWIVAYLLNATWQAAVIAAVALFSIRWMRAASWQARHLLAVAALLTAVLLPAWTTWSSMHPWSEKVAVTILPSSHGSPATAPAAHRAGLLRRFNGSLPIAPAMSRVAALLYLAFLLCPAAVLLTTWRATRRLLRSATPAELPAEIKGEWRRWLAAFHLPDVLLLASRQIAGPVTLGFRQPALLLPPDFLATASRDEVKAALCHEFAHIARHDFLANLLLEIASLPIAFHPACWLLKRQIDESRELVCDRIAAQLANGADHYARSLLSLARALCAPATGQAAASTTGALGIFEANILEKRIMNLIEPKTSTSRAAKLASAFLGAGLLGATAIGISTLGIAAANAQAPSGFASFLGTWKTTVNGKPAAIVELFEYQGKLTGDVSNGDFGVDEKNNNAITGWTYGTPGGAPIVEASISGQTLAFKTVDSGGPVSWELTLATPGKAELRVADAMPNGSKLPALPAERVAASPKKDDAQTPAATDANENDAHPRLLSSVNPEYTPEARAAKFSGKCIVGLTVDATGKPIDVKVVKPLGMGLDENAVKAVSQYRFSPAMRDGVAVPADLKIEVEFRYY